jgi:DNA invertase Pin-like site-specific DNA recombinase
MSTEGGNRNMAHVGYIRVSSIDQNTDRQLADLDCNLVEVFEEKARSGFGKLDQ